MIHMPSIKEHIKSSKRRSGREYKEVHEWLDGSRLSYSERLSRHHPSRENLAIVRKQFGSGGMVEYLHHLDEDHVQNPLSGALIKMLLVGK